MSTQDGHWRVVCGGRLDVVSHILEYVGEIARILFLKPLLKIFVLICSWDEALLARVQGSMEILPSSILLHFTRSKDGGRRNFASNARGGRRHLVAESP